MEEEILDQISDRGFRVGRFTQRRDRTYPWETICFAEVPSSERGRQHRRYFRLSPSADGGWSMDLVAHSESMKPVETILGYLEEVISVDDFLGRTFFDQLRALRLYNALRERRSLCLDDFEKASGRGRLVVYRYSETSLKQGQELPCDGLYVERTVHAAASRWPGPGYGVVCSLEGDVVAVYYQGIQVA